MISWLDFLRFGLRLYVRMIWLPMIQIALPGKAREKKSK